MNNALPTHSSYAALFDPAVARAAAARAAQWNLPRQVCRPLDRYAGKRVNAELAAFDAAVEQAPVAIDEVVDERPSQCGKAAAPDFDDEDF